MSLIMSSLCREEQLPQRDTFEGNPILHPFQSFFEHTSDQAKSTVLEELPSDIQQNRSNEKLPIFSDTSVVIKNFQKRDIQLNTALKLKENQLKSSDNIMESFRKHMTELQLQNEELSQKLELEIITKEQFTKTIEDTSAQNSCVQHCLTEIEKRFTEYEQAVVDSENVQSTAKEHCEGLAKRFQKLTLEHENKCQIHQSEIKSKENEIVKLKSELHALSLNMEEKLCSMEIECKQKTNVIEELQSNLNSLQERIKSQEANNEILQTKLEQNEHLLHSVEQQLFEKLNKLKDYKDLVQTTRKLLIKTKQIFTVASVTDQCNVEEEAELMPCEQMMEFQDTFYAIGNKFQEKEADIASLTEKMQHLESETGNLKLQKDAITMENATLNKHLKDLHDEKLILSKAYEEINQNLQTELKEKQTLAFDFEQLCKIKGDIEILQNKIMEKNKQIDGFVDKMKTLQESYNVERDEKQNVMRDLEAETSSKAAINAKLKECEQQLELMQSEMKMLINKNRFTEQQLADANTNKEQAELLVQELKEKIEVQFSEKNDLKTKLHLRSAEFEKLETKLKSLEAVKRHNAIAKKTLLERTKCVTELQKIKTEYEIILKTKDDRLVSVENELADLKTSFVKEQDEKSRLIVKIESDSKELQKMKTDNEHLLNAKDEHIAAVEKEMADLKTLLAKEQEEKNRLIVKHESSAKEMVALMENFKLNNLTVIKEKDKEIKEGHDTLENLTKKHESILMKKDNEIAELKEEIENINKKLQRANESNVNCLKQLSDVKQQLKAKDEEMKLQNKNTNRIISPKPSTPQRKNEVKNLDPLTNSKDTAISILQPTATSTDKKKRVTFFNLPSPHDSETSASEVEVEIVAKKPDISKTNRVSPYSISLRPTRSRATAENSKNVTSSKQLEILGDPKPVLRDQLTDTTPKLKKMKQDTDIKYATPERKSNVIATPERKSNVITTPERKSNVITTPKQNRRVLKSPKEMDTEVSTPKPNIGNKFFKSTPAERKTYWTEKKEKSNENSIWCDLDGIFEFPYD